LGALSTHVLWLFSTIAGKSEWAKRKFEMIPVKRPDQAAIFLVGGGIASLAAAVFLIRDGDVQGHTITILEESSRIGGSLDAAGNAAEGYVMRGGRMIESKYLCTYDLFSSIPTLDGSKSVTQEIFDWNETMKTASKSRLFRDGRRVDSPSFGLSEKDIFNLERLAMEPEELLGRTTISDQFAPGFFETDFWHMWCTTFAFQPWHSAVEFKRYLLRFTHMVSGFNTLTGIMRTVYNQFDSTVRPLYKWLEERGVKFMLNTTVTDLVLLQDRAGFAVDKIVVLENGVPRSICVSEDDKVIVTLGSMTEGSSLGSMDSAAALLGKTDGGSWALWEKIAAGQTQFGHPSNFSDHIDQSKWMSFTTTLHDPRRARPKNTRRIPWRRPMPSRCSTTTPSALAAKHVCRLAMKLIACPRTLCYLAGSGTCRWV
jgi:oleate hydratase